MKTRYKIATLFTLFGVLLITACSSSENINSEARKKYVESFINARTNEGVNILAHIPAEELEANQAIFFIPEKSVDSTPHSFSYEDPMTDELVRRHIALNPTKIVPSHGETIILKTLSGELVALYRIEDEIFDNGIKVVLQPNDTEFGSYIYVSQEFVPSEKRYEEISKGIWSYDLAEEEINTHWYKNKKEVTATTQETLAKIDQESLVRKEKNINFVELDFTTRQICYKGTDSPISKSFFYIKDNRVYRMEKEGTPTTDLLGVLSDDEKSFQLYTHRVYKKQCVQSSNITPDRYIPNTGEEIGLLSEKEIIQNSNNTLHSPCVNLNNLELIYIQYTKKFNKIDN